MGPDFNGPTSNSPSCQDYGSLKEIKSSHFYGMVMPDSFNSRLKVVEFRGTDLAAFVQQLMNIAANDGLEKIIFNARENEKNMLIKQGFTLEGIIPEFFKGADCYCLSFFLNKKRGISLHMSKEDKLLKDIENSKRSFPQVPLPKKLNIRMAEIEDVPKLVDLYKKIFATYPSPLLDEDFVRSVINLSTYFVAIFAEDAVVSAASAEVDHDNKSAEITDCATHPDYRGRGLLTKLIKALENAMWQKEMGVLYSLARAGSYGMNAVLYKLNYQYTGRMINNCHIGGRFEDMNIWAKTAKYET